MPHAQIHNLRPEFVAPVAEERSPVVVMRPVGTWHRIWSIAALRKALILAGLLALWQGYGMWLHDALLFPTLTATISAFASGVADGTLLARTAMSLEVLLIGYVIGVGIATILAVLAMTTRFGGDFLETVTPLLNPLPAIALLPLALIWFGLGTGSLVFVLVHSVLWVVALNAHSGFRAVSPTLRMVGRNYGLKGPRLVLYILIPAAFPSILTGLKIGWAFAWRTLIAAELVFGVSSGSGGLGWYIFENRNNLEIPSVFAGLLMVILIGLTIDYLVFRPVETRTVRKWGMQS